MNSLINCPIECKKHSLSFLNVTDLATMAQSCRHFHTLSAQINSRGGKVQLIAQGILCFWNQGIKIPDGRVWCTTKILNDFYIIPHHTAHATSCFLVDRTTLNAVPIRIQSIFVKATISYIIFNNGVASSIVLFDRKNKTERRLEIENFRDCEEISPNTIVTTSSSGSNSEVITWDISEKLPKKLHAHPLPEQVRKMQRFGQVLLFRGWNPDSSVWRYDLSCLNQPPEKIAKEIERGGSDDIVIKCKDDNIRAWAVSEKGFKEVWNVEYDTKTPLFRTSMSEVICVNEDWVILRRNIVSLVSRGSTSDIVILNRSTGKTEGIIPWARTVFGKTDLFLNPRNVPGYPEYILWKDILIGNYIGKLFFWILPEGRRIAAPSLPKNSKLINVTYEAGKLAIVCFNDAIKQFQLFTLENREALKSIRAKRISTMSAIAQAQPRSCLQRIIDAIMAIWQFICSQFRRILFCG